MPSAPAAKNRIGSQCQAFGTASAEYLGINHPPIEASINCMQIHFIDSIHQVAAADWDRLCPTDYPFVRHAFLAALEDSASTTATQGWQAQHLVIYEDQQLIAAMPGYLKAHSYGEYVFDWAWADAYRRYGENYYPKWISAIPFTPCYGPRLLHSADVNAATKAQLWEQLVAALTIHVNDKGLSGWHCLFPTNTESDQLIHHAAVQRLGCQFHWYNKNYRDFDDFVARMNSRKRKNILKERKQVNAQGFVFHVKTGVDLQPQDWDIFYQLYRNTYSKRSGHAGYLTAEFFQLLGRDLPNNVVLITATKPAAVGAGAVIAASLYMRDATTLYGRYWGCFEEYDFLHFETCYYQGIDYAIAQGLARFDGGAQGEHKIARGFEPTLTYSNHWIADPHFRAAINHFIAQEAEGIKGYAQQARELLPFK